MQKFKGKVPGYAVKAVDTTGAGDSFVGSFLVSLGKDGSILEVSLHFFFQVFGYIRHIFMDRVCVFV